MYILHSITYSGNFPIFNITGQCLFIIHDICFICVFSEAIELKTVLDTRLSFNNWEHRTEYD